MLRALSKSHAAAVRILAPRAAVLVETVRGRKSRFDPKAKSKADRIKVPSYSNAKDMFRLNVRFSEYQLLVRAIRFMFTEKRKKRKYEEEKGTLAEERVRKEKEEHRALMAWNDAENLKQRIIREERLKKITEAKELKLREEVLLHQKEQEIYIKEKEMLILQLQEEVKNFITQQNLDERIEEALNNPKSYNYAIDKTGQITKRTAFQ
ncbi:hypothetical protein DNTS_032731 [Danionella cerebrum]|uniref:Small ribosomal subunit protein mS26 n=1 Tax=Danionella cerebrum TaxID=2873325 RepID=A0A553NW06_9TELE|nr:hypothetical protein DNTS_032731 [Danionella translucida]